MPIRYGYAHQSKVNVGEFSRISSYLGKMEPVVTVAIFEASKGSNLMILSELVSYPRLMHLDYS